MSTKLFVGQNGCLFEAVHAFADLDVRKAPGIEVGREKIVVGDDLLG